MVTTFGASATPRGSVAQCQCGWVLHSDLHVAQGRVVAVLHVLVRHPAWYAASTGRDPEEALESVYREALTPEIRAVL
jgi:hypothetical protein